MNKKVELSEKIKGKWERCRAGQLSKRPERHEKPAKASTLRKFPVKVMFLAQQATRHVLNRTRPTKSPSPTKVSKFEIFSTYKRWILFILDYLVP